uniref:Uncharacterized protein n=1 Tax=Anguilla anguilla TaxID=7936 RepID=A0A0E9TC47_ANGAN
MLYYPVRLQVTVSIGTTVIGYQIMKLIMAQNRNA